MSQLDEMDYIEGRLAETPLRKTGWTTIDPMTEHDANVRRRPYVVLAVWTALALVPMVVLTRVMTAPVTPGCFEYCNLSQQLAAFGFRFVGLLWLLGVLVVAWDWRDREPSIAAASAVAAAIPLTVVVPGLLYVGQGTLFTEDQILLAWVVNLGLQLPPVWRLSRRATPSTPLRVVVGIMDLAVVAAALSILLFGTSFVWSAGPYGVLIAWVTSQIGVLLVAIAAWRDRILPPYVVGPLVVASLPVLLVPVGIVAPGNIAYVIFLAFPLTAIAWIWLAVAWLRGIGIEPSRP
jgi:hypothetical protein